ncbi:hypothetical protein HY310_03220 [Candidatus Microgenomates bacterium]|nr:hypothetical protein [Candidatus Microgenomates bacterium]
MVKFLPLLIALIIFAVVYTLPRSELISRAYIERAKSSTGEVDLNAKKGVWEGKELKIPTEEIAAIVSRLPDKNVLGVTNGEKWI